jgi:hypothetical protein
MQHATDLLTQAAEIVKARGAEHGDKRANHEKIALLWNAILMAAGAAPARPIDAHLVASMMEGLKIARRFTGGFNRDDYLDAAGYAGVAFEIAANEPPIGDGKPGLSGA